MNINKNDKENGLQKSAIGVQRVFNARVLNVAKSDFYHPMD